jgi:hypothetical protein
LRESFARARSASIGKQAWSVLSVITEQTASYSRLSERIPVARISAVTGISERRVRELANVLEAAQCIKRVRSRGRYPSQYSLVLPEDKAQELATMLAAEQGRLEEPGPLSSTDTLPAGGQPTEEGGRDAAAAEEPADFVEAVALLPGAPARGSQRAAWLRAYLEAPRGFIRALEAARKHGKSPPALLTAKLQAGEHLMYRDAGMYRLQIHDPKETAPRVEGPYDGEYARSRRGELMAQGFDVIMVKEPS